MQKSLRTAIAAAASAAFLAAGLGAVKADVGYYSPPKFKNKVLPAYPDSARAAHETGSVVVKILVDTSGSAKQFIIFKSSGHKDLDNSVLAAVKASTYAPAMEGSSPKVAFLDVTYKFTLTGVAQDEGSQSDLSKKLQANPHDVSVRIAVGTNYLNQRNYSAAEQTFQAGTQTAASNAKMWAMLGLSYYQDAQANNNDKTKYKEASDAYDHALKLDPKVETSNIAPAAYFNYGFQLQQSGDTATALTYAQKAVSLAKESQYYILLGEVQTSQGDYASAISSIKQAEALDKKKNSIVTARIVADLGNAELAQGDKANGMADLARSEQINGQAPFAYEYQYSYYVKTGDRAAALRPLGQLEQLQPKEVQWPLAVGNIYLGQNNAAAARQAFQRAQAIDPNNTDVQFAMAQLSAASGDTAAVASAMQKITSTASPKQAAIYESTIAIQLINATSGSKNYAADAQKYADSATKHDPDNGEGWFALGYVQAQQKQRDDAGASLKKAYAIFKAQNNQSGMKQVSDIYKQVFGSDISS